MLFCNVVARRCLRRLWAYRELPEASYNCSLNEWQFNDCDTSKVTVSHFFGAVSFAHSSIEPRFLTIPFEDTSMKKSLLLASLIAAMALAPFGKKT